MATILLAAAGAAAGASVGGGVLGLSSVVIGRAIGATVGRVIDQAIMGGGSESVETGRIDRLRLTGASEGAPLARLHGRMRLAGQVIWASGFTEHRETTSTGGKGTAPRVTTRSYSYTISLAIALCEGEITHVGRIWADGVEIAPGDLNLRVYTGSEDQLPDPAIEAEMGIGAAPAYRGTAYVVIEDLDVTRFGNRVPVLNFEVHRPEQPGAEAELARGIRAVAMIPGTGEYALATTPVHYTGGLGRAVVANEATPQGRTDFAASLAALEGEVPNCGAVSLVVSWFGDDLRCGSCTISPRVEQAEADGRGMPWRVSGLTRETAGLVPQEGGRPVYGGTPTDQSVVEALEALAGAGMSACFYPFVLMDQLDGNGRTDPWTGSEDQPRLPWRGRITLSAAPGQDGSPDESAAAETEVAAFFGQAAPGDFTPSGRSVGYTGPAEMSYRRFILHYAHLCALAGGVERFLVGSELRGLTRIRGAGGTFPAVEALIALVEDVRAILGPEVQVSYAADWTEYHSYQPPEGGLLFPLDPLWSHAEVDFVGIDNYLPLADWREGEDHLDAAWGDIRSLDYLRANIEGGEYYDWYYHAPEARAAQLRTPITDGAHDEPWVWRLKDLRGWWENDHHARPGGVRAASPTGWVPGSKPIVFTELGCAAIDKGANQPNKFLDPKSSESALPRYSNGRRDDAMQRQFLRAHFAHWADPARNPVDPVSGHRMVDMEHCYLWAWDARPFPAFPGDRTRWADGDNYARGHWLNGRVSAISLAGAMREIAGVAGISGGALDTTALHGTLRGYLRGRVETARAALQPLMLAYGAEAVERGGRLTLFSRGGEPGEAIDPARLADSAEVEGTLELTRAAEADLAGRVRLSFVESDGDYETRAAEAIFPDTPTHGVAATELPLVLTGGEGRAITERWLAEARVARDALRLALPPSRFDLGAGDVIRVPGEAGTGLYRVEHVTRAEAQVIEARRIEPHLHEPSDSAEAAVRPRPFTPAVPVLPLFLDLPLMSGEEVPHAPHVAVTADPWPGSVAVHDAPEDAGYALNTLLPAAASIGVSETAMLAARAGLYDRGPALRVRFAGGGPAALSEAALLAGGNLAAIGDGSTGNWELFQFRDAVMVGPETWELSMRLRGQAGSDGIMPPAWPVGSAVVLIDTRLRQLDLAAATRGLARHYRVGPAARSVDDPVYVHEVHAFDGIGLRPYAPAHLRAEGAPGSDIALGWVRRSRLDDGSWEGGEVPLGEESEAYLLRVMDGETILREVALGTPAHVYTAAQQAADGALAPFEIAVAQVSARFGPGPFRRLEIGA